jgi:hypothetical protein
MTTVYYTDSTPGTTVNLLSESESLANWSTAKIAMTEGTGANTGRWSATVATNGRYKVFEGTSQPSDWENNVGTIVVDDSLNELLDRTNTAVTVVSNNPVAADGTLGPLIIGDDYLAANGRALQWTIAEVTGLTAANCVCKLGLKGVAGAKVITGTVTDLGNTWLLSVDMENNDWDGLTEGLAEYSVEVHQGTGNGTDVTVVINELCGGVILREKQT